MFIFDYFFFIFEKVDFFIGYFDELSFEFVFFKYGRKWEGKDISFSLLG